MADRPYSPRDERTLATELWDPRLADDLEKFVMFVYPWGKSGTPLHDKKGPRTWQRDELQRMTDHIKENKTRIARGLSPQVYRSATASGRGIGKSSLVAWINHWAMTCHLGGTVINSANTEDQLKNKTWGELGKWHALSINSHWFDLQALSMRPHDWFAREIKKDFGIDSKYYYATAQLWSEEKPDNYAGAHNPQGMCVIFDEASGIPAPIWGLTDGFFTEKSLHRYWFAFSNPRRNTGAFFECFHGNREFWYTRNLDARTIEENDQAVYEKIIKQYGEDSDEARIEVKGEFPRQGDKQFISRDIVSEAVARETVSDPAAALIMGVDPARYGDDTTVIRFRQGRDARSYPVIKLKGKDNMAVANECASLIERFNPDAVCIDAGNGTGIIDRLRELKFKVHEVWFGGKAENEEWANKRTEMWATMREWLRGGCIDNDKDLIQDLTSPEYRFQGSGDRITLESKEEIKKRGFHSPDNGDALACTFAVKVARRDLRASRSGGNTRNRVARDVDYPILG